MQKTPAVDMVGMGVYNMHSFEHFDGHSPKPTIISSNNNLTGVGLALGKTICFGSLEFTAYRYGPSMAMGEPLYRTPYFSSHGFSQARSWQCRFTSALLFSA
jgi:hypothetical protein